MIISQVIYMAKRCALNRFWLIAVCILLFLGNQAGAQCSLFDTSRDALFITYEGTARVKTDDRKVRDGVLLRLHNNSSCPVIISSGSAKNFVKPRPANATVLQRINPEIEYVLPDNALVPEVQYEYESSRGPRLSVGGDMFFGFQLLGKRSILFEVPMNHFRWPLALIEIPFDYSWENENRAQERYKSVKHKVYFSASNLPEELIEQVGK